MAALRVCDVCGINTDACYQKGRTRIVEGNYLYKTATLFKVDLCDKHKAELCALANEWLKNEQFQHTLNTIEKGEKHHFDIFFNGAPVSNLTGIESYDDIRHRFFSACETPPDVLLTITFSDGPSSNPSGSLKKGESVQVCDGMIFNATWLGCLE